MAHRTQESTLLTITGLLEKDTTQGQPNGRNAQGEEGGTWSSYAPCGCLAPAAP